MAKRILISVLTPTKNRASTYVPMCIESVQGQRQTDFDFEHIIVNDGSTDNTAEVLKQYAKKYPNIKIINRKVSGGPAKAYNSAFKKSKGSLIVPFDDDDIMPPASLQIRYEYMRDNPRVDWSSGYLLHIDENNKLMLDKMDQATPDIPSQKRLFATMIATNVIKNDTVTIRRQALTKAGGWDEKIHAGQDWGLWTDLLFHGCRHGLIKSYLAIYRLHKKMRSANFSQDAGWRQTNLYCKEKYNIK